MPIAVCPNSAELEAFAVGDLAEPAFGRVAEHVLGCPRCDAELFQFDRREDRLLAGLRGLATEPLADGVAPPEELLTAARNAGNGEVSIDCGRRFAKRLADGPCRLGKFELQAELGSGSFGYVFRARDTELDRTVAIKIQRAGALADAEERSRFLREARSAAQLQHPGIVSLHEIGQTDEGVCYLVTEFIDGQTLADRLKAKPVAPRWGAELLAQIAEALEYAHAHGVIHRDLKPSNILIDEQGRPHLMDFGLAKRAGGERTMTTDGRVMGTPAYMSPEQARGESHSVDARTDVYSLGVILYEMLTGVRPFQGEKRLLVLQVLEDEPRPPRQLSDQAPRDLETICLKAMAKTPGRRYQAAGEFADDLRRWLDGKPIKARRVGLAERAWRWSRRNPLAASLLLAVTLGSAAGFWYLSRLSEYFIQAAALDSTRIEIAMLEEVNQFYSDVIDRVDWKKTPVTHEYAKTPNSLPLPATFLIDAGQRISKTEAGAKVRLYSDHPWRKNVQGRDAFEQKAIGELERKAKANDRDLAYYEFTEIEGRPSLRYGKAQLMKPTCVKCHNNDETSPKRDWKEGDLAGVLAITRPLDRDIERTRSGFRFAFLLTGAIAALPLGFGVWAMLRNRVRRGKA